MLYPRLHAYVLHGGKVTLNEVRQFWQPLAVGYLMIDESARHCQSSVALRHHTVAGYKMTAESTYRPS